MYTMERLSDGTFRVRWSETGDVGVVGGTGRRFEVDAGEAGIAYGTSGSGTLRIGFEEGVVGTFATEAAATEFVRAHAG